MRAHRTQVLFNIQIHDVHVANSSALNDSNRLPLRLLWHVCNYRWMPAAKALRPRKAHSILHSVKSTEKALHLLFIEF